MTRIDKAITIGLLCILGAAFILAAYWGIQAGHEAKISPPVPCAALAVKHIIIPPGTTVTINGDTITVRYTDDDTVFTAPDPQEKK